MGFLDIYNNDSFFGNITNIGMNTEISIKDLAHQIATVMGLSLTITTSPDRVRPENSEVERLVCDNSKLLKHTSWKPKYTLTKGISEVLEWIKTPENLSKYKGEKYNV